jgi:hypothetical protein
MAADIYCVRGEIEASATNQPTNQPRFLPKPVLFFSFFSHDEMEPQRCLAGLHRMGATHAIPQLRVLAAN